MHAAARKFCVEHAWRIENNNGFALDIGGRNVNGHARDLWPKMTWTIIDKNHPLPVGSYEYADSTIVGDAIGWTPDKHYDLVLCTEVFEHCEQWPELVKTAYRALKPDGYFIITCAGPGRKAHSSFDGGPVLFPGEFYANVIPDVLGRVLKDCGFYGFVIYNPWAFDNYVFAKKVES